MVSSQKSKTSVTSGKQMHKNAYIFRTTHLVRWCYYSICRKTAPCEKEPWWLIVRPSGKDQESGRARVPGSSIGFMFESCFYQYKPVPDFCFQCFFYLKHVRASVGAQSPFLCVVHVNIAAPPAQRKEFHQNSGMIGHLGKKAWARVPPGPSNGSPSPCSPLALWSYLRLK